MIHTYFITDGIESRMVDLTPGAVYEVLRDGFTVTFMR